MADYFAVLNRTLSGFTDPKPQLREKLYDRARSTIERQLKMKTPAPDAASLQAELQKLENAIGDIERNYNPEYVDSVLGIAEEPVAPVVEAEQEVATEPEMPTEPQVQVNEAVPEPVVEPEPVVPPIEPELVQPQEVVEPPVFAPAEVPEIVEPEPMAVIAPEPPVASELPVAETWPQTEELVESIPEPIAEPVVASVVEPETDPIDEWANEFLANDPSVEAVETPVPVLEQPQVPPATSLDPVFDPLVDEVPAADEYVAEELVIPPAVGHATAAAKPKRKFGKWLLTLLILLSLGAAGAYGWMHKDSLIERFGLNQYFDDPTRPKPVKTITITPEPEPETSEVEPQPETTVTPKTETRLTENGEEVTPKPTTTTPEVTLPPATETVTQQAEAIEPAPAGATPSVAQTAILYEEGSTKDQNSIDAGRIVWSVVQEATGNGTATEPAIRGRVEIPDRSAVLIMTIKRNVDKALPASHLIELVFAVPDDFSGGTIENINRYVLKENEQGTGEPLVGVPAKIADGIFLIALNNLADAKQKNTTLLRERDWIDIPMQYRTGRRALMTIEKGIPGEKIFKEVFDAWDKLDAT